MKCSRMILIMTMSTRRFFFFYRKKSSISLEYLPKYYSQKIIVTTL